MQELFDVVYVIMFMRSLIGCKLLYKYLNPINFSCGFVWFFFRLVKHLVMCWQNHKSTGGDFQEIIVFVSRTFMKDT